MLAVGLRRLLPGHVRAPGSRRDTGSLRGLSHGQALSHTIHNTALARLVQDQPNGQRRSSGATATLGQVTLIAVASTNVYTVTFDGRTVQVLAKQRQKLLRTIPLDTLTGVDFKPARGVGGGSLRFHTTGPASSRDRILFLSGQQHDMEMLAAAVQRYWRPQAPLAAPSDPWSDHPVTVTGSPRRGAVLLNGQASARPLLRMLRLGVWLEGINLVLLMVPVVLVALAFGAFLVLR